jgi:hypothetical protein
MALQVPADAATVGSGGPIVDEVEQETSLSEEALGVGDRIYRAVTGEGASIEYPTVPETTDIEDVGFWEGLGTNVRLMFVRDDWGKAEVIKENFGKDERFGGVYSDEFDNPMIIWNEKPYYINKPGVSEQDIGTFAGELVKYTPASRFVSGAKTMGSTIARGLPAYSTTELAGRSIETALTPEATAQRQEGLGDLAEDVGMAASLGTAADIIVPPVIKGAAQAVKGVAKPVIEGTAEVIRTTAPRITPVLESLAQRAGGGTQQESKYPLTAGQRTAPLPDRASPTEKVTEQLEAEDVMRRAPSTDPTAQQILRGFDDQQIEAIRTDARALQEEFGSGSESVLGAEDVPQAAAETAAGVVRSRATQTKQAASESYEAVKSAPDQPFLTVDGRVTMANDALAVLDNLGIEERLLAQMPLLRGEVQYLQQILKAAEDGTLEALDLTKLHGYQKALNAAGRQAAPGSPEALALGQMKRVVDQTVFDGIEKGLIEGEQAVLDELKKATGLYRQYVGLTGKETAKTSPQKAANKIMETLSNPEYTSLQIANLLFGHAKFAPNQAIGLALKKLQTNMPKEEYDQVVALFKDAILEKAFTGGRAGGITRTAIVNSYNDVFVKNKDIVKMIFTPDELAKISQFRKDVMPTLWAEIKLNPSGSGYTVLSGMARSGLLQYGKFVPFVREGIEVGEGMVAAGQARDAVRQYVARQQAPLFSTATASSLRTAAAMGEDETPSTVKNVIEGLSPEAREQILQATQ